jgi:tRNA G18 (ribose-2'-O)-methylase SpoU
MNILQKIRLLASEIESIAEDGKFPEKRLSDLILLLGSLNMDHRPEYQQLAEIADHLHPGMTVKHFLNFMIPIERTLGQNLREDQFLVTKLDRESPVEKFPLVFLLENIRSAFNVGSIYRLADGVGASEIHLCGYSPKPDAKTSLGAGEVVETKLWHSLDESVLSLKSRGFSVWALETAVNATSLFKWIPAGPTALVVGNERFGLEASALQKMDGVLELPMSGIKNSLNVSNALSAAAFEWKRQWVSKGLKP